MPLWNNFSTMVTPHVCSPKAPLCLSLSLSLSLLERSGVWWLLAKVRCWKVETIWPKGAKFESAQGRASPRIGNRSRPWARDALLASRGKGEIKEGLSILFSWSTMLEWHFSSLWDGKGGFYLPVSLHTYLSEILHSKFGYHLSQFGSIIFLLLSYSSVYKTIQENPLFFSNILQREAEWNLLNKVR